MKQIIQDMKSGRTVLEEVPVPQVKSGYVLVKTSCSLVSLGTERMLVEFGKANLIDKARQQPDKVKQVLDKIKTDGLQPTLEAVFNKLGQPLPLGYCNSGVVVAVGNGVTEVKVGDRVASNGQHAEYVCVPKNLVAKIPENVSDEEKKAAKTVVKESQKKFVADLASLGDCWINDAFGTAHRAHASTALIAKYFPNDKMFGYVMEGELKAVDSVMKHPQRPFTAIMGGSKVSSKIDIIMNLMDKVDNLILGGGMTYTFKAALGGHVGSSICETDKLDLALDIMRIAKEKGIAIFIVGHVTKEGVVAGPRVLEHMVDTVLYFEGDRHASYRILRGVKNRFGSTNEIGVFEMRENGLEEVENPSEYMLNGKPKGASGSVVTCAMEGTRPLLLEIQALVCRTNFGIPRRTTAGTDYNRVNLLMAVLEKRMGFQLGDCDAYVNITGGMKMNEPSMDLGIVLALISSYKDKAIPDNAIIFGEVGLSGEVRGVNMAEQRILEAQKMGFEICVLPKVTKEGIRQKTQMQLIGVENLREAVKWVLGGK